MGKRKSFWCLISLFIISASSAFQNTLVVILCQKNVLSLKKCKNLEDDLSEFSYKAILNIPRDYSLDGAWTIIPLIPWIDKQCGNCKRVLFLTEDTLVDSENLIALLHPSKSESDTFVGLSLRDSEPTIIHHFSTNLELSYPLFSAGFFLSQTLIKSLAEAILKEKRDSRGDYFSIDSSYEFAQYVNETTGQLLKHSNKFCIEFSPKCVTSLRKEDFKSKLELDKILFGVKTCERFHKDRVPVVQNTWGKLARNLIFYSDVYDKNIPTVKLDVTNTPYGHCAKTQAIIQDLRKRLLQNENILWAVISDDDTIFGVTQLQKLLIKYDPEIRQVIGERYGYNLRWYPNGYNYLTGGSGLVFSRSALLAFKDDICPCPSPSSPDDMFLFGVCLKRLEIDLVHSPRFHQARPDDYTKEYLSIEQPVSFHKHWMLDPAKVHKKWFPEDYFTEHHNEL